MPKSVLIVEDDPTTSRSFGQAIASLPTLALIASVRTVASAIEFLSTQPVDVCLVDLGLPDGSGLEVIKFASDRPKPAHCLVVTVFGDETSIVAAIEAGASGYILKDALTMSVAAEIETLLAGGSPLSPLVAKMLLKRFRAAQPQRVPEQEQVRLSPRETEVLNLIARGCTYSEVSHALGISSVTVATHLNNVYVKLSVHSRTEAVYEANRLGLIKF
jgi:DNA-binding NarL/FixJ family response regulator